MTRSQSSVRVVPLSQHARPAFTQRGTCKVCTLPDVVCTTDSVCALCTMQGRA